MGLGFRVYGLRLTKQTCGVIVDEALGALGVERREIGSEEVVTAECVHHTHMSHHHTHMSHHLGSEEVVTAECVPGHILKVSISSLSIVHSIGHRLFQNLYLQPLRQEKAFSSSRQRLSRSALTKEEGKF